MRIIYKLLCYKYNSPDDRELLNSHVFRGGSPLNLREEAIWVFDLFEANSQCCEEMVDFELHLSIENDHGHEIDSFILLSKDYGVTASGLMNESIVYNEYCPE